MMKASEIVIHLVMEYCNYASALEAAKELLNVAEEAGERKLAKELRSAVRKLEEAAVS